MRKKSIVCFLMFCLIAITLTSCKKESSDFQMKKDMKFQEKNTEQEQKKVKMNSGDAQGDKDETKKKEETKKKDQKKQEQKKEEKKKEDADKGKSKKSKEKGKGTSDNGGGNNQNSKGKNTGKGEKVPGKGGRKGGVDTNNDDPPDVDINVGDDEDLVE